MIDRVPWATLHAQLRQNWRQSQHVGICAPTGRGKTVLIQQLTPMRDHVVFLGTKKEDEEYERMQYQMGFVRTEKFPPQYGFQNKVMLWPYPEPTMAKFKAKQQRIFRPALDYLFLKGKWTVVFDELHYTSHDLGLYDSIATLHHQGRSAKLTFVDGFQRPAFVPVIVYSSATHWFFWQTNYREDLKKMSSVAKLDALSMAQLSELMKSLDEFEFVYVNVRGKTPPVISQVKR